jgi:hypothetical protein
LSKKPAISSKASLASGEVFAGVLIAFPPVPVFFLMLQRVAQRVAHYGRSSATPALREYSCKPATNFRPRPIATAIRR